MVSNIYTAFIKCIYLYNRTVEARQLTVRRKHVTRGFVHSVDQSVILHLILLQLCTDGRRALPAKVSFGINAVIMCFFFSLNGRSQVSKYTVAPLHVLFLFRLFFFFSICFT